MSRSISSPRGEAIPVFLYHALFKGRDPRLTLRERKYWMPAERFGEHLAFFRRAGYRLHPLEQAWQPAQAQPSVALTFDDGRSSDYSIAWPLLVESGLTATFFLNTALVGATGHLRWNQVREMAREGASFQSHGHHHVDLTRLAAPALSDELRMSKDLIEFHTCRPVNFLSVPYGRVNRKVVEAALESGYRAVCISRAWLAKPGETIVARIPVYSRTTVGELARLAARKRLPYLIRRARETMLAAAKLLLPLPAEELRRESAGNS
jgi:peptidoglycan/xylan/chitin deacetylase (PgdA/CDA1 family)